MNYDLKSTCFSGEMFVVVRWDLSQGFRGPKDFNSRGSKDVKRSDSHNGSEASTGSGSSHTVRSRASKLSDTSTASGWDEPVTRGGFFLSLSRPGLTCWHEFFTLKIFEDVFFGKKGQSDYSDILSEIG